MGSQASPTSSRSLSSWSSLDASSQLSKGSGRESVSLLGPTNGQPSSESPDGSSGHPSDVFSKPSSVAVRGRGRTLVAGQVGDDRAAVVPVEDAVAVVIVVLEHPEHVRAAAEDRLTGETGARVGPLDDRVGHLGRAIDRG